VPHPHIQEACHSRRAGKNPQSVPDKNNLFTYPPDFLSLIGLGGFDYDTSKLAEFEFYLLEELEFYLIVYHPYRDLTLIAKDLKLEESNLQTAW